MEMQRHRKPSYKAYGEFIKENKTPQLFTTFKMSWDVLRAKIERHALSQLGHNHKPLGF